MKNIKCIVFSVFLATFNSSAFAACTISDPVRNKIWRLMTPTTSFDTNPPSMSSWRCEPLTFNTNGTIKTSVRSCEVLGGSSGTSYYDVIGGQIFYTSGGQTKCAYRVALKMRANQGSFVINFDLYGVLTPDKNQLIGNAFQNWIYDNRVNYAAGSFNMVNTNH